MNRKQAIAAAVIALAGSAAFAQTEVELQHFGAAQPSVSTSARAAAKPAPVEADVAAPKAAKGLTRAEVRAEVLKAGADGSLTRPADVNATGGNTLASVRTREEVRAEAIADARAAKAGRVQAGY